MGACRWTWCSASSTICSHSGLGMIEVCLGQTPTRQLRKGNHLSGSTSANSPNLSRIHVPHQTNTWLQILLDFSWKSHDHTSSSSKSSLNAFHLSINERPILDLASPLGKRFFQKDCVSRRRASETPIDPLVDWTDNVGLPNSAHQKWWSIYCTVNIHIEISFPPYFHMCIEVSFSPYIHFWHFSQRL